MRYKIKQSSKKKEKLEPTATLFFEKSDNAIDIIVTMENGRSWRLLKLNSNGTFTRHGYIGKDLGFKVSKDGYLKEQK